MGLNLQSLLLSPRTKLDKEIKVAELSMKALTVQLELPKKVKHRYSVDDIWRASTKKGKRLKDRLYVVAFTRTQVLFHNIDLDVWEIGETYGNGYAFIGEDIVDECVHFNE